MQMSGRRPGASGGSEDEENHSEKNGHVGEVEDSGVQWAQANDTEVGDHTLLRKSVHEVAEAARRHQSQGDSGAAQNGRTRAPESDEDSDENGSRGDREDEQTRAWRKRVAETEKTARISRQGEVNDAAEEGAGGAIRQRLPRYLLRGLIATDQRADENREQQQLADSEARHALESIGRI